MSGAETAVGDAGDCEVIEREVMEFDVLIVGAGPAGLSAAIRLRQKAVELDLDLSVCVLEKGSEVGAHILSGAVMETTALDELLPNWRDLGAPLDVPVTEDQVLFLTEKRAVTLPPPPSMQNHGNYIVSLGNVCRWLAEQAEGLGVDIFPGFAAAEPLIENDRVVGVITGDMGRDADGQPGDHFQPGIALRAKTTLVAEGCRGSLAQTLIKRYGLDRTCQPQTYGLGIKELWDVDPVQHKDGLVMHTVGWPLKGMGKDATYGGGFIYHVGNNQIALGLVIGLDYKNPHFSPFEEMQRWKTHPAIATMLKGGKRVSYGARTISEGGYQSIPDLTFPGGALLGDSAGLVNMPKIKGSHTAMMSGILAADATIEALREQARDAAAKDQTGTASGIRPRLYTVKMADSWVLEELKAVRNVRPAFHFGLWPGMVYAALEAYVLKGRTPWTFGHVPDHQTLRPVAEMKPIDYSKPDGVLTFDKPSSVYLANTTHEESQPAHLKLVNEEVPVAHNFPIFAGPEQRYCPAGVYEYTQDGARDGTGDGTGDAGDADHMGQGQMAFHINASNCVHCKACDIKDPLRNIRWTVPEGGSGPNYPNM